MKVIFHPEFPRDQREFQADYNAISLGLGDRFKQEIAEAIEAIKSSPTAAGHFVSGSSGVVTEFRRAIFKHFRSSCFTDGLQNGSYSAQSSLAVQILLIG